MPRWVMVWVKLEGLLPPLRLRHAVSSGSPTDAHMGHGVVKLEGLLPPTQAETGCLLWVHGVGSDGVRSGREPPVSMAGRRTGLSGDREMLIPGTSQDQSLEED